MSDTANTHDGARSAAEIEDVLSSIRRLVSEHQSKPARPAANVDPAAFDTTSPTTELQRDPGAPLAQEEEKLVLTPSQRVNELDDPWAPVASPAPLYEDAPENGTTPQATETTDGKPETEAEPEIADGDASAEAPRDKLYDWADTAAFNEARAREKQEKAAQPSAEPVASRDTTEHVDTELFEPEAGEPDWPAKETDDALRSLASARAARLVGASAGPNVKSSTSTAPMPEVDNRPDANPATIPVDEPEDTPEYASSAADPAPATETTADVGDTNDLDRASDDVEDLGDATSPFSFPDNDGAIIDEETLREIVADVVREELQGVLGQRITRNVRKMVRREIRLALAVEDLD